jgi:Glycosyltransferase
MSSILFITTRNVVNTGGELRLIKNRANILYNNWKISTSIYAFLSEKKLNRKHEELGNGCEITCIGYDSNDLAKLIHRYRLFKNKIMYKLETDNNIKSIIVSGILPINIIRTIKKEYPNLKIIADIHGAIEELLEYPQDKYKKMKLNIIQYYIFNQNIKKTLLLSDGALVVSNELKKYIIQKYKVDNKFRFYKVPCGTVINEIDIIKNAKKNRQMWRDKLLIEKDTVLFIYSGGISKWQSIDDVFTMFDNIKNKIKYKTKLLIMSNQIDKIQEKYQRSNDVIFRSFESDQVQEVLLAGDVALLLREKSITNRVAFPNKFSEYMASGMLLIATEYVADQAEIIKSNDLGIIFDGNFEETIAELKEKIVYRQNHIEETLIKHITCLKKFNFETTLEEYASDIENDINL